MYQRKAHVDMLNAVKSVLADVSRSKAKRGPQRKVDGDMLGTVKRVTKG